MNQNLIMCLTMVITPSKDSIRYIYTTLVFTKKIIDFFEIIENQPITNISKANEFKFTLAVLIKLLCIKANSFLSN